MRGCGADCRLRPPRVTASLIDSDVTGMEGTRDDAVMDLLRENVRRNADRLAGTAEVLELEWGSEVDARRVQGEARRRALGGGSGLTRAADGPWHLVVGSDILYLRAAYEPLLETLAAVASPSKATVLLAFATSRVADHEETFVTLAEARGFNVSVVKRVEAGGEVLGGKVGEDVAVISLRFGLPLTEWRAALSPQR